ncbi:MAG: hypothetical protein LBH43_14410 [Treponema sp.]|jgi:hypothetical protein|nr:hypothetical protein [Treponema sp.]
MKKYLWITALLAVFALIFAGCASTGGGGSKAKQDELPDMDEGPAVDYEFSEIIDVILGDWNGRTSFGINSYLDNILNAGEASYIRLSLSGVGAESQGMGIGDIASYIENPRTGEWPPYRIIFDSKVSKTFNVFINFKDMFEKMFEDGNGPTKSDIGNLSVQIFNNFSGKIVGIRLYLTEED